MQSVTVTALHPFYLGGQYVRPGDVVSVPAIQAASLKYRGVAKLGGYRTAAMQAQTAEAELPPSQEQAEAPAPEPDTETVTAPRRRRYRRRDVTAEE